MKIDIPILRYPPLYVQQEQAALVSKLLMAQVIVHHKATADRLATQLVQEVYKHPWWKGDE